MEPSSCFIPQEEREQLQSYGIITDTILLDGVSILEEPSNVIVRALVWSILKSVTLMVAKLGLIRRSLI